MFDKRQAYENALREIDALLDDETQGILKMATINCILKEHLPYYFWVGFYAVHRGALVVSAYQGTLGCLHISYERGVCGRAARTAQTQIVTNVHDDPEHIACDSRSCSEIVVPVFDNQHRLIAVFDVDSTEEGSFDELDKLYLERLFRTHFEEKPVQMHYDC